MKHFITTGILSGLVCVGLVTTADTARAWPPGFERALPPPPGEGPNWSDIYRQLADRLGNDACARAARAYAYDPDRQGVPANTEVFPGFERLRNNPRLEPGPRGQYQLAWQLTNECRSNMPVYFGRCAASAQQNWADCYVRIRDSGRCRQSVQSRQHACLDSRYPGK